MTAAVVPPQVHAAGTVVWRVKDGSFQVLLIHRQRYDDWSWPKGKADPGEHATVTAVRETREETGYDVRLGIPLPTARYRVARRGTRRDREVEGSDSEGKVVRYWAATPLGDAGDRHGDEVDEVRWVDVPTAKSLITREGDLVQLRAALRAYRRGALTTRPVVVVRHAVAKGRKHWDGDDRERPLDTRGHRQSAWLAPVMAAYRPARLVSSSAERCVATFRPAGELLAMPVQCRDSLTEETAERGLRPARATMRSLLSRREPVAVCGHRPVLPLMLGALADLPGDDGVRRRLRRRADRGMKKGEVLVIHVTKGGKPRLVALERHLPSS